MSLFPSPPPRDPLPPAAPPALAAPHCFDPGRPDFAPYGLTCQSWRPSPMRRPDHHNEIELNFLRTGSLTYLLGGSRVVLHAGCLHAFWAAIPHQIVAYDRDPAYYVATIPLPWFLQWRLPDAFVQALLGGQIVRDAAPERTLLDRQLFAHWAHDLALQRAEVDRAVLMEMQARLMRLAIEAPVAPPAARRPDEPAGLSDIGLSKVERMACYIARHYTEHITVQDIARAVNLHPNYAMNLFHRLIGTTFIHYLTQHRVSHAQRLLTTTDLTVAEVALNSGFNSISRFNDSFRRYCGVPPRRYRQEHQKRLPPTAVAA